MHRMLEWKWSWVIIKQLWVLNFCLLPSQMPAEIEGKNLCSTLNLHKPAVKVKLDFVCKRNSAKNVKNFSRGKQGLNLNYLKLSLSFSKPSITIWTSLESDHKNYFQMTFLRIRHPLASQKLLSSLEIFHLETQNARKNSPCTDFHRRLYILEFLVEWICALIVASPFALVCWFERSWKHALKNYCSLWFRLI